MVAPERNQSRSACEQDDRPSLTQIRDRGCLNLSAVIDTVARSTRSTPTHQMLPSPGACGFLAAGVEIKFASHTTLTPAS